MDEETEHLVITTCDAFDTATPNIIARNSLQGQALERIYDNNISRLDGDLVAALSNTEPAGDVAKEGKTVRYPLGTVATIDHPGRKLYFVAVTRMDENNNAQGTPRRALD